MSTLGWIILGGVAMSAIALVGGLAALLPQPVLDRVLLPIVGLAAGSLLGGAFFHMLPSAIDALGNNLAVYVWVVAGFVSFFALDQELGDFGVLIQGGWTKRSALLWNFVSALTFLIGGVVAYFSADVVDVAYLLPFAAGNFIYIASADLIPELATHRAGRDKLETTASLLGGLAILYAATWIG